MRALVLVMMLALCGCQSIFGRVPPPVIVYKPVLVKIPDDLLVCPGVRYPDWRTLTDAQIGRLIVALETTNHDCRLNMKAIRRIQAEAEARLARGKGS